MSREYLRWETTVIEVADEFFDQELDLDVERVKEDFETIWSKNIIEVDLIRELNPSANDYFAEGENPNAIRRKVWLNVQGVSTDAYRRMVAGIITPDSTYNCFAKWDEDIQNEDIIKIGTFTFRVQNHNKSMYAGQYVFQEFQLKRIDKVE